MMCSVMPGSTGNKLSFQIFMEINVFSLAGLEKVI